MLDRIALRQQGFTLIELVVVIIILGILAVTAAPKFFNLQKDAKISALEGARAAFASTNNLVYSKALLQGQENVDATTANIDLDGNGTKDIIGYYGLIKFVVSAREYSSLDNDITISKHYGGSAPGLPWFVIYFAANPPSAGYACHIEVFYPATPGGTVTYVLQDANC
ncbi:pilus assembly FimT family protein [Shewanella sp. GXUN23E]|uniref:pilus assembly FimT family protein n=1 Tax=Shewanella sp. GXUN23E TaxID=3422498 RepID=UPI003D7DB45D